MKRWENFLYKKELEDLECLDRRKDWEMGLVT